jgi:hypothetical protein
MVLSAVVTVIVEHLMHAIQPPSSYLISQLPYGSRHGTIGSFNFCRGAPSTLCMLTHFVVDPIFSLSSTEAYLGIYSTAPCASWGIPNLQGKNRFSSIFSLDHKIEFSHLADSLISHDDILRIQETPNDIPASWPNERLDTTSE